MGGRRVGARVWVRVWVRVRVRVRVRARVRVRVRVRVRGLGSRLEALGRPAPRLPPRDKVYGVRREGGCVPVRRAVPG